MNLMSGLSFSVQRDKVQFALIRVTSKQCKIFNKLQILVIPASYFEIYSMVLAFTLFEVIKQFYSSVKLTLRRYFKSSNTKVAITLTLRNPWHFIQLAVVYVCLLRRKRLSFQLCRCCHHSTNIGLWDTSDRFLHFIYSFCSSTIYWRWRVTASWSLASAGPISLWTDVDLRV